MNKQLNYITPVLINKQLSYITLPLNKQLTELYYPSIDE